MIYLIVEQIGGLTARSEACCHTLQSTCGVSSRYFSRYSIKRHPRRQVLSKLDIRKKLCTQSGKPGRNDGRGKPGRIDMEIRR